MSGPANVGPRFTNLYQLYKSYTTDVCQWLLVNSGYTVQSADKSSSDQPSESAGKLKGKARQLAKVEQLRIKQLHQHTAPSIPSAKDKSNKCLDGSVGVDRLVEMARKIAKNPEKLSSLPRSLIAKLKKSILLRRQYMVIYASKSNKGYYEEIKSVDYESNNLRHAHFVHILENVLEILNPAVKNLQRETMKSTTPSNPYDPHVKNSFQVLELEDVIDNDEELSDWTTQAQPSITKPHSKTNVTNDGSKDDEDREEVLFAIFCFFKDMNELKLSIREYWHQYKSHLISLETVTLVCNMSISAVRQAEKEFFKNFGWYFPTAHAHGYQTIAVLLFDQICVERGHKPGYYFNLKDPYKPDMADMVELLCLTTFVTIYSLAEGFAREKHRGIPWGIVDEGEDPKAESRKYDSNADRSQMSYKWITDQDRALLCDTFTDFCVMERFGLSDQYHDEFSKTMRKIFRSANVGSAINRKSITVADIFAAQLFIDSNSILRSEVERPLQELQTVARLAEASLTQFLDNNKPGPKGRTIWPDDNHKFIQSILKDVVQGTILSDPLTAIQQQMAKNSQHEWRIRPPFYLQKRHPLLAGTQLIALRLLLHECGSSIFRAWDSALSVAHAYNAFRQVGGLDIKWPQMEWLISFYTPEKLFAGCLPTTLDKCFKCFELTRGASLCKYSPNARRSKGKHQFAKCKKKRSRKWTNSVLLEILKDWIKLPRSHPANRVDRMTARLMALTKPSGKQENQSARDQILAVKVLFEAELPGLEFEMLEFHFRCVELVKEIHHELYDHLANAIDPNFFRGEFLFALIRQILTVANKPQRVLATMNEPHHFISKGSRVMKEFILAQIKVCEEEENPTGVCYSHHPK